MVLDTYSNHYGTSNEINFRNLRTLMIEFVAAKSKRACRYCHHVRCKTSNIIIGLSFEKEKKKKKEMCVCLCVEIIMNLFVLYTL